MSDEYVAKVSLMRDATASDVKSLVGRLDTSYWSVERVHDPEDEDPDLYLKRAGGSDE